MKSSAPPFTLMPPIVFSVCLAALLVSLTVPAHSAPIIDWVTVGDPGNAADTTGFGAVSTSFQIMRYEFTNQQYTDFLNSVAATDTYSLYNARMGSDPRGGITQSGSSGSYTYAAKTDMSSKPVIFVSWWDAARVSNWLMNGATGTSSTETGAYTLSGTTSGDAPAVNPAATYFVPTEDQWYKAAFYKAGSTNAGYWAYATQSAALPAAVSATTLGTGTSGSVSPVTIGNFANYDNAASWNGQTGNVTTVGTNGGASAYGTFDMNGNANEWNDLTGATNYYRGLRGGGFFSGANELSSAPYHPSVLPSLEGGIGFRLAAPVAVPEPSTCVMALAGLACGGYSMFRRRRAS